MHNFHGDTLNPSPYIDEDRASAVYELARRIATGSCGDHPEQAYAELRGAIGECLDAGMEEALHRSLGHAADANDRAARACIAAAIEDEAQSAFILSTRADSHPALGSLFAVPVLIYSIKPFLARRIPAKDGLDPLLASFRGAGLIDDSASIHLDSYLYTPDELWALTWSEVRALASKIADSHGNGAIVPADEFCQSGQTRPVAFAGDNASLNLRYIVGVLARPVAAASAVEAKSAGALKSLDESRMAAWTESARDHLERVLHEPRSAPEKDILIDVLEPHPFYEAFRQGANGYNILSFMLQFDDLLSTNHLGPEQVAAIFALYADSDRNLTARASIYTYAEEQVIGGCSYDVFPFEDADEAVLTIKEHLTEQGVADLSCVTDVLPHSICAECGEPMLIGPHPGNGKDPTLGLAHRHYRT